MSEILAMAQTLQNLHDRLGLIAELIVSVTTIVSVPPLRKFCWALIQAGWRNLNAGSALERIERKIGAIEKEVKPNGGGSMKDSLARMEASVGRFESFRRHDFWTKGKPAMELDEHGQVDLVSDAACRLFHVSNPEELYRRSWLRFLEGRRCDEFLRSFCETAKSDSQFRFTVRLQDNAGENRGEWEFRAVRIEPDVGGKKLYSGHWNPMDAIAREVADRNRWAN